MLLKIFTYVTLTETRQRCKNGNKNKQKLVDSYCLFPTTQPVGHGRRVKSTLSFIMWLSRHLQSADCFLLHTACEQPRSAKRTVLPTRELDTDYYRPPPPFRDRPSRSGTTPLSYSQKALLFAGQLIRLSFFVNCPSSQVFLNIFFC